MPVSTAALFLLGSVDLAIKKVQDNSMTERFRNSLAEEPLSISLLPSAQGFVDMLLMIFENSTSGKDRTEARKTLIRIAQMAANHDEAVLSVDESEPIGKTKFL
tara:strand:+ start:242 stop:553 length:312 start_codon:yes stop_codon:yes gene_type:complete